MAATESASCPCKCSCSKARTIPKIKELGLFKLSVANVQKHHTYYVFMNYEKQIEGKTN
jgi:hypothetical protein